MEDITPECIYAILSSETSNAKLANKMMLDCMIAKITCKEGLLDLCDQLEKISNAPSMTTIVSQLRTGKNWPLISTQKDVGIAYLIHQC